MQNEMLTNSDIDRFFIHFSSGTIPSVHDSLPVGVVRLSSKKSSRQKGRRIPHFILAKIPYRNEPYDKL